MTFAETLPARWYGDVDVHRAERDAVFASTWQLVARADALSAPGSSVHVEVAGFPLVLVRPPDGGALRGFHDVCRHRAGPLTCTGGGAGASLVCGYHGWTYDLDGRLVRARDFGADPDVSLRRVRVEAWRGFVFVRMDGDDGAPSLVDDLAGFADASADFPMESFRFDGEVVHELGCNWKTYADNYLEGYHIPIVHPELDATIDSRRYEVTVHERGRWARHHAPARDGSATTGVWLWRHPNLALNVYPDGMNVERFLPDGPTRTRIVYWYFFAPDASPAAVEASRKLSASLMDEDRAICEAVQRNLDAGVYERGPLSPRHESGVAAFQRWVRDAVEPSPLPG
jgi:choline monooxygenase